MVCKLGPFDSMQEPNLINGKKKSLKFFLPNFDLKNMISIDIREFHGTNGQNWPNFKGKNSKPPDIFIIISHK